MKIRFVHFSENDIGWSHIRSCARSHDHESCDHGVIIAFFFGVSSDEQVIKSYLQLDKKPPNPTGERGRKLVLLQKPPSPIERIR